MTMSMSHKRSYTIATPIDNGIRSNEPKRPASSARASSGSNWPSGEPGMDSSNATVPNPADTRPKTTHLVCCRSAEEDTNRYRYICELIAMQAMVVNTAKSSRGNDVAMSKIDLGKSQ